MPHVTPRKKAIQQWYRKSRRGWVPDFSIDAAHTICLSAALQYRPIFRTSTRSTHNKVPLFMGKIIQMFDVFNIRFGATLVGPTGAGKTTCYRMLAAVMTDLRNKGSTNPDFQVGGRAQQSKVMLKDRLQERTTALLLSFVDSSPCPPRSLSTSKPLRVRC